MAKEDGPQLISKLISEYSESGVKMRLQRIYNEARRAKAEGREVRPELLIFLINE